MTAGATCCTQARHHGVGVDRRRLRGADGGHRHWGSRWQTETAAATEHKSCGLAAQFAVAG